MMALIVIMRCCMCTKLKLFSFSYIKHSLHENLQKVIFLALAAKVSEPSKSFGQDWALWPRGYAVTDSCV